MARAHRRYHFRAFPRAGGGAGQFRTHSKPDRPGRPPRHALLLAAALAIGSARVPAQDCDGDGVEDRLELGAEVVFEAAVHFAAGDEPLTLAVADADGDGLLDVAAANLQSGSVTLLLSARARPEELFAAPREVCIAYQPRGIAWLDVNSDGLPDLLVGAEGRLDDSPDQRAPRVLVLPSTPGEGPGLPPACPPPCDSSTLPTCLPMDLPARLEGADAIRTLDVADLDGDGRRDVVIGYRSVPSRVAALFRHNDGGFSPPITLGATSLVESRYVLARDLDGDGDVDLATASGEVLFGPFQEAGPARPVTVVANVTQIPRGVAIFDANADGLQDLAFTSAREAATGPGGGSLLVALGLGGRRFQTQASPDLELLCDLVESLVPVDLDQDGDLDLVATRLAVADAPPCDLFGLETMLNDGRGKFSPGPFLDTHPGRPRWVLPVDLGRGNGEGLALIVAINAPAKDPDEIFVLRPARTRPGDANRNGRLDRCELHRGDVDQDLRLTIGDAVVVLGFLFLGRSAPTCLEAADTNDDGTVSLSDPVALLGHLFLGAEPLPPPGLDPASPCTWPGDWTDPSGLLECEPGCPARS